MKLLSVFFAAFIACTPAAAQWQTPNHSVPIGRGAGVTGFGSALPSVAGVPFLSNGVSADPAYGALDLGGPGATGQVPITRNCPGATGASSTTFLRGDCVWAAPGAVAGVSNINSMTGAILCSVGLVCGGNVLQTTPNGIFNVYAYGARPDYHENSTLSANSGSPTALSASDHPFNVGMVGNLVAINGMGSGTGYFGSITGFTDDNHVTISPGIVTTQVNQFGQICADQTVSIQAAIDAAKAVGGGTVLFPAVGTYCVTQLNATQAVCCQLSLNIQGAAAVAGARLMPMQNVNAVIDVTGTSPFNLNNMSMGLDHQVATPTVGLLIAPTTGNPGIDFYNLNNSFLTGRYAKATLYLDRAASSTCRKVSFINYFQGGGAGYAMIATNNNVYGVSSAFQSTLVGVESVSDWNFTGCEWHTIASGGGTSLFSAMFLDSTANFQFFGGNAASSNPSIITISGTTLNLLFQGTTFYSDVGPQPQHVFGGAGNLNRTGIYFTNNIITGAVNATSGTTTSFVQVP